MLSLLQVMNVSVRLGASLQGFWFGTEIMAAFWPWAWVCTCVQRVHHRGKWVVQNNWGEWTSALWGTGFPYWERRQVTCTKRQIQSEMNSGIPNIPQHRECGTWAPGSFFHTSHAFVTSSSSAWLCGGSHWSFAGRRKEIAQFVSQTGTSWEYWASSWQNQYGLYCGGMENRTKILRGGASKLCCAHVKVSAGGQMCKYNLINDEGGCHTW